MPVSGFLGLVLVTLVCRSERRSLTGDGRGRQPPTARDAVVVAALPGDSFPQDL